MEPRSSPNLSVKRKHDNDDFDLNDTPRLETKVIDVQGHVDAAPEPGTEVIDVRGPADTVRPRGVTDEILPSQSNFEPRGASTSILCNSPPEDEVGEKIKVTIPIDVVEKIEVPLSVHSVEPRKILKTNIVRELSDHGAARVPPLARLHEFRIPLDTNSFSSGFLNVSIAVTFESNNTEGTVVPRVQDADVQDADEEAAMSGAEEVVISCAEGAATVLGMDMDKCASPAQDVTQICAEEAQDTTRVLAEEVANPVQDTTRVCGSRGTSAAAEVDGSEIPLEAVKRAATGEPHEAAPEAVKGNLAVTKPFAEAAGFCGSRGTSAAEVDGRAATGRPHEGVKGNQAITKANREAVGVEGVVAPKPVNKAGGGQATKKPADDAAGDEEPPKAPSSGDKGGKRLRDATTPQGFDDPVICVICDDGGDNLLSCEGICHRNFHAKKDDRIDCETLCLSAGAVETMGEFHCQNCTYEIQQCFVCGKLGAAQANNGSPEVIMCEIPSCRKFYHVECLSKSVLFKTKTVITEANGVKKVICPRHQCRTCNTEEAEPGKLVQCRRCPKAWHADCLKNYKKSKEKRFIKIWGHGDRHYVYCRNHKLIAALQTPARHHIEFPSLS